MNASLQTKRPREILDPKLSPVAIDPALDCVSTPARQALDYWRSLCTGGRPMPRRRELSPFAMRGFLAHINLVDVVRDAEGRVVDYVLTLQGQHTHEIYGAVANRKLEEVLPPHLVERWRRGFALVCQVARPIRFSSGMDAGGKTWLAGEALVAPLGEAGRIEALYVVFASWNAQHPAESAR